MVYLESTGTQYIKLGVIPTKDIHIKMDFQLTNTSSSALSMFGSTTYTDNTLRILLDYGSAYSNRFCSNWGNLGNNNTERTVNYSAATGTQDMYGR